LLLANGMCVTRQELLDAVWGHDAGVDGSIVDIYLRRLRAKLRPVEIENVRGVGYRITARPEPPA
jgi:DNA-binding response OmpR family regulator